jgi:hypothetical protein
MRACALAGMPPFTRITVMLQASPTTTSNMPGIRTFTKPKVSSNE